MSVPALDVDDGAVVVAEMAEQPPEALRSAGVAVRDHEHALADPGPRGGGREPLGIRQRVPSRVRNRQVGQILVHVEKRRARNVSGAVELAPARRIAELPAAVHELVAHPASIPFRFQIV